MSNSTARPSGGNGDARAGADPKQLDLEHDALGVALDGEVIPPAAATAPVKKHCPKHYPPTAEMDRLFAEVNSSYAEFVTSLKSTVQKAAVIGRALIKVKESLPHGTWLSWLERRTKVTRRQAARFMALAKAEAELPRRNWSALTNLGFESALTELSRRKRAEQEAEREAEIPTRIPAPVQRDDPDDGPDRFVEMVRFGPEERRQAAVEREQVLSEELEQVAPRLHERVTAGEISPVEAALEFAKDSVRGAVPRVTIEELAHETFSQEEEARLHHVAHVCETLSAVKNMTEMLDVLFPAFQVGVHGEQPDYIKVLDTCIEIAGRFHGALCLHRDQLLAKGSGS